MAASWAVVRGPGGGFGWIPSRTPEISADRRAETGTPMGEAGVDPARLTDTKRPPQRSEPEGNCGQGRVRSPRRSGTVLLPVPV